MATTVRRNSAGLNTQLMEKGYRFDFFQAVRLLQRVKPQADSVGSGDDPDREAIRFQSQVSLAFPPSDIVKISPAAEEDEPSRMMVSFMGVATPASFGSLPLPYAEMILALERDKRQGLRAFLDLFNHRLVSMFYRAWEKYRFAISYERNPDGPAGPFERAVFSLMGIRPGGGSRSGMVMEENALLARAYAVKGRSASARSLADLIQDYFRVPVTVQQFVPHWYEIEKSEQFSLGVRSCSLGRDTHLGSQVRLVQSRFRLNLGPLGWNRFRDFLPTGTGARPLAEMTALAAGPEFDFDCKLILKAEETPRIRLGVIDDKGAPWLGWTTWLQSDHPDLDSANIVIDGDLMAQAGPVPA
jgi:type VI secretion system protein ImpH